MQTPQFQLHADIEQRHWWFVGRRRIMSRLVEELLPASPETVVIDVGCGTGANIAALANSYACVGIDTSAEAIELAQSRFPQVRFFTGLAPDDLGDLVRQARLILLMDVLEHVSDDFQLLSRLLAAASPGCYFLLTVPADESLWSEHDESFGHYRRYDVGRLEKVWTGLPVSTLLLSYFNSGLLPLIRMIRAWNRRRGHAAGRAGTDFWMPNPVSNYLLEHTLAGESKRLIKVLRRQQSRGYSCGASLMAVLRRGDGSITPRTKPSDIAPDHRL
jgi:SAM-dependent methyltransferase